MNETAVVTSGGTVHTIVLSVLSMFGWPFSDNLKKPPSHNQKVSRKHRFPTERIDSTFLVAIR
jgi:hypothetical protein